MDKDVSFVCYAITCRTNRQRICAIFLCVCLNVIAFKCASWNSYHEIAFDVPR